MRKPADSVRYFNQAICAMSDDYFLLRVPIDQNSAGTDKQTLIFGSQDKIIERFSSEISFEVLSRRDLPNIESWVTIAYTYHNKNDQGRRVKFALHEDPLACISINRAYPEDFLPVINVLSDLGPFLIQGPEDEPINPEDFFYSYDDWIQKNYEYEDDLSFRYKR